MKLGVEVDQARSQRRSFAHRCLDWSERRHHLAGALGSVILDFLIQQKWLLPTDSPRELRVSREGKEAAARWLGVEW
ncbi:hypothetical protein ACFQ40_11020 [Kroppenstedtia eburnea]|uniref:hypothetical protein n=1 Tax=Kroppenstedtia eburnea TaxID=714067 RepID=UPI00363BB688